MYCTPLLRWQTPATWSKYINEKILLLLPSVIIQPSNRLYEKLKGFEHKMSKLAIKRIQEILNLLNNKPNPLGFDLLLNMCYFSQIPLMASLYILCSDPLNFSNEITKKLKLGKNIRKHFVTHQKFSKIFHDPSMCLKYFMAPTKVLRRPSYILNVRPLKKGNTFGNVPVKILRET